MKTGKLRELGSTLGLLSLVFSISLFFPIFLQAEFDSLYLKGNAQFQEQHFDSAIIYFSRVIAEFPQKKEGYFNRGLCYYKTGQYDKATSDFDTCVQIDSVFKEAKFLKALALQKKGELNKAFTELEMLNTRYSGYNGLKNRIRNYHIAVILSRNWYYMIALMFMCILLIAVVAKSYSYKR